MDNSTDLGRLAQISDLRTIWENEAGAFTPWLARAENLKLLGDTIGIELELEATEKNVGPFRADILCKDTVNNQWVLIENQLEKTDHTHMGQLMTYAAGLKAATIVWIADHFREEHRAALDWLNEITDEQFNFFGLEIELWKIGDSAIAPKLNVASKPNDWSKTVKTRVTDGDLSPTKTLQLDYWDKFCQFMEDGNSIVKCQTPKPHNWTCFAVGRSNFQLVARMNTQAKEIGVYLCMQGDDRLAHYHLLLNRHQKQVDSSIGPDLKWRELRDAKESQIATNRQADPTNQNEWPAQHKWLKDTLESFHRTFAPIVKQLDATEYQPDDAIEGIDGNP